MEVWRTDKQRRAFSEERIVGGIEVRQREESFSRERIAGGIEVRQIEESFKWRENSFRDGGQKNRGKLLLERE